MDYREIQFTKAPQVLKGMGAGEIEKTEEALHQLAEKGMAPGGLDVSSAPVEGDGERASSP